MGYQISEVEKDFLRKCHADCAAFLAVCGGFEPLLAAGLLEGKTATAPRPFIPMVQQLAPSTKWVEKRWVRDGKIWTTGALLNGMDMIAAFGRETWGVNHPLIEHSTSLGAWPERDVDYAVEA